MIAEKHIIRSQCIAAREALDAQVMKSLASELNTHLLQAIPAKGVVAGYFPIRCEADVTATLMQCHMRGQEICLPVITDKKEPLSFRRWQMGEKLQKGEYGIEVPHDSEPLLAPDVVIVPLVAFDPTGHRLGYGAGFYDRTIARLREAGNNVLIIGAAYSSQQVEALPGEAHDQRLNAIVTEQGVTRF